MKQCHRVLTLPVVLFLGVLIYVACAPDEVGISQLQIGEMDTPEPTRAEQDCRQCIPELLKATLQSVPPVSSTGANPISLAETAVEQVTPLNVTASPEPARALRATPTFAPGYELWVIDVSIEEFPSKHQIVFHFPTDKWYRRDIEGETIENPNSHQASILHHREIEGCVVSENFGPPLTWSSVEEDVGLPFDRYDSIKIYRGAEGEMLLQVIKLPTAEIRISFPSSFQRECQVDSLAVVSEYVIVDLSKSTPP